MEKGFFYWKFYGQLLVEKTNLKISKVTFLYGRNINLELFRLVFFHQHQQLAVIQI
jgi:hypothetical protein